MDYYERKQEALFVGRERRLQGACFSNRHSSGKTLTSDSRQIVCKDTPPLLPHADSLVGRRATFAKNTIWVTPYEDGQLYP